MSERKAVYTVRDRGEGKKAYWARIGTCFTNKDGSFSVILDALPIDGKLVIREEQQRDEQEPRRQQRQAEPQRRNAFEDDFGGSRSDDIPF